MSSPRTNLRAAIAVVVSITLFASGAFVLATTPGQASATAAATASDLAITSATAPLPTHPDFTVPAPPQEPTRVSPDTKYTTRLWGSNPYEEAVSVTQEIYPAARGANSPGETNNVGDRPWGIVLVTPHDPLVGISATPLIHFPNDAPILYVTRHGIPKVTLDEIKRLDPTGIIRDHNIAIIAIQGAANPVVLHQLAQLKAQMGLDYTSITAPNAFELANKIDAYYGQIQNPDLGVPTMGTSASSSGNGIMDVMIGSVNAWQYILPATHWVSHMPSGLLWVTKNSIPAPTIAALKRRQGHAIIYVWGGHNQISRSVVRQLAQYGSVQRITNNDPVAYNRPPVDTPMATSIAFAKMWDPVGMVGWNITGPGHGFTVVNVNNWQGAVGSAILSHLGFHAPLLLTDNSQKLPSSLGGYFQSVAPTFLVSPADGPYNMTYVIGNYNQVSWPEQSMIDYLSGMANRHVWSQNTGSVYIAPR